MYRIALTFFLLLAAIGTIAQSRYTVSGTLTDKKNGETLIGATIYVLGSGGGSATNAYGFYSITLPAGKYHLLFRMVGFKTDTVEIDLRKNLKLNQSLTENAQELTEVVISAKKKR